MCSNYILHQLLKFFIKNTTSSYEFGFIVTKVIQKLYRTRMANSALKCQIIILITSRSLCNYNNILIIIRHPWTILTENSAS